MAGPARLVIEVVSDATPAQRSLGDLDKAADDAGQSIDKLGRKADEFSTKTRDMGKGAADSIDEAGGKAGKTATGLNDLAGAFELLNLPGVGENMGLVATAMDAAAGAADLFTVAQSLAAAAVTAVGNSVAFQTVKTIALTAASKVAAIATRTWAAVQWVLNAAMSANPIGLIVLAIAALVAGIVLAYQKSETFRRIVDAAFKAVSAAAKTVWEWIKKVADVVAGAFVGAWNAAGDAIGDLVDWFKEAWEWLKKLWDKITSIKLPSWMSSIGDLFGKSANISVANSYAATAAAWYPHRARDTAAAVLKPLRARRSSDPQIIVQVSDRKLVDLIDVSIRASATAAARDLTRRRVVTV